MREKRMMLGISLLLLVLTGVSFLFFPAEEPSMSRMLLESQEELLGTLEDTEEELLTKLLFAGEIPRSMILVFLLAGQVALFLYDKAYEYFLISMWSHVRERIFGKN